MKYGELPKDLGQHEINCKEMFFYQYLPIKLMGEAQPVYEERLKCFDKMVGIVCCDFIGVFGLNAYVNSYVYLTAKHLYQAPGCSFNRPGYHSDGFMTDDINYVWCDRFPTIFNTSEFILTMDDSGSLIEMEQQALKENETTFPENSLLRLNQFNIHKINEIEKPSMRTFLKVSFSKDKYDLIGNAKNYLLKYDWQMKERKEERNIPQSSIELQEVQGSDTTDDHSSTNAGPNKEN
jgi:hypothetical protein